MGWREWREAGSEGTRAGECSWWAALSSVGLAAIPSPRSHLTPSAAVLCLKVMGRREVVAGFISAPVSFCFSQHPNPTVLCLHSAACWGADGPRVHE